jgi:RNA recognition motif-containing protein
MFCLPVFAFDDAASPVDPAQCRRVGIAARPALQCCIATPYRRGRLTRRAVPSQRAGKSAGVPRHADCMWVRNNKGNVFVGNLPPDFSDERLAETFDPYGIVLSAAVARDPSTGARLRYGFVDIATERAMTQAISALDGSEIDGCKLNVKPREKATKKAGVAPPRRMPLRAAAQRPAAQRPTAPHLSREPSPGNEIEPPQPGGLRPSPGFAMDAAPRPSQSQMAREGLPEIEPPPRRDFEVVRRPLRRTTPNFQVERRSLPRRV